MDVLSEVLKAVKLHGAMYYNGEFAVPWSVRSPAAETIAAYLGVKEKHVIVYHLLLGGRASIRLESGPRPLLIARLSANFRLRLPAFAASHGQIIEIASPRKPVAVRRHAGRVCFFRKAVVRDHFTREGKLKLKNPLFLIQNAIQRVGAQMVKVRPRKRELAYRLTHIVRRQPRPLSLSQCRMVSIPPQRQGMRAVLIPLLFLLSALLAN